MLQHSFLEQTHFRKKGVIRMSQELPPNQNSFRTKCPKCKRPVTCMQKNGVPQFFNDLCCMDPHEC